MNTQLDHASATLALKGKTIDGRVSFATTVRHARRFSWPGTTVTALGHDFHVGLGPRQSTHFGQRARS